LAAAPSGFGKRTSTKGDDLDRVAHASWRASHPAQIDQGEVAAQVP
jgi:hypothetical protein